MAQMGDRGRGFPSRCRCGEVAQMKTSGTPKNPGRLFIACPYGKEGDWSHLFRWTDTCMVEEIEDLIEKVENFGEVSSTLQKGLKALREQISNVEFESRVCEGLLRKEIQECKMQLRCLKNILGVTLVMGLFFVYLF